MPDDDWRYRKAQQLGLIDMRPLGATGDGRRPAAPAPVTPRREWAPAYAAPGPKARAAARTPSDAPRRLAFVGGTAMALLVAAGAGWLLNDAVDERSVAEFPLPSVPAAAPATPDIEAPTAAVELPASAPEPAPRAIETAPPRVDPPLPTPAIAVLPRRASASARPRAAVSKRIAGPSFNCRHARTADSRLICASPELSGLDREIARSYRAAVRRGGPAAENALDSEQAAFLNARAACQTAPCIARLYYRRLEVLG